MAEKKAADSKTATEETQKTTSTERAATKAPVKKAPAKKAKPAKGAKKDAPFALDPDIDKAIAAEEAIRSKRILKMVVNGLSGDNRRMRQYCASVVYLVSDSNIEKVQPFSEELADALHRPEAQTRWEILKALTRLVDVDARAVDKAIAGAEASLYDEDSGVVRLEAFRMLCAYGATTEARSNKVWPYIDEAIQCYHGDPEFNSMLISVLQLIQGNASKEVRKAAGERMKFDAENSKGALKIRSQQILTASRKRK